MMNAPDEAMPRIRKHSNLCSLSVTVARTAIKNDASSPAALRCAMQWSDCARSGQQSETFQYLGTSRCRCPGTLVSEGLVLVSPVTYETRHTQNSLVAQGELHGIGACFDGTGRLAGRPEFFAAVVLSSLRSGYAQRGSLFKQNPGASLWGRWACAICMAFRLEFTRVMLEGGTWAVSHDGSAPTKSPRLLDDLEQRQIRLAYQAECQHHVEIHDLAPIGPAEQDYRNWPAPCASAPASGSRTARLAWRIPPGNTVEGRLTLPGARSACHRGRRWRRGLSPTAKLRRWFRPLPRVVEFRAGDLLTVCRSVADRHHRRVVRSAAVADPRTKNLNP